MPKQPYIDEEHRKWEENQRRKKAAKAMWEKNQGGYIPSTEFKEQLYNSDDVINELNKRKEDTGTSPPPTPVIPQGGVAANAYDAQGNKYEGAYVVDGTTYTPDGGTLNTGDVAEVNGKYFMRGVGEITQQQFMDIVAPTKIVSDSDTTFNSPDRLVGRDFTEDYGIQYNRDEIEAMMQDAITAQYEALALEQARNEELFGENLANLQSTVLDTINQGDINAIATGASRGMSDAQQLSAVLGLASEGVLGATGLADQRYQASLDKTAAEANVPLAATELANQTGLSMAEIAALIQNAEMVGYGSELGYISDDKGYAASLQAALAQAASGGSTGGGYTPPVDPEAAWFQNMSPEEQTAYMALLAGDDSLWKALGSTSPLGAGGLAGIEDMFTPGGSIYGPEWDKAMEDANTGESVTHRDRIVDVDGVRPVYEEAGTGRRYTLGPNGKYKIYQD